MFRAVGLAGWTMGTTMKLNERFTDDRAVSPVVGVSMLIGITVILAAVLGTVVLGVGVGPAATPQATLSFAVVDDTIELHHEGGEALDAEEIVILDEDGAEVDPGLETDLATGERQVIVNDRTSVDRVSVVWKDPRGDSEQILATFEQ